MADETRIVENIYLINAPAGSGKTTRIKSMLYDILLTHPKDNILCITYTNRAAEELARDIDAPNIYIGTIHSYIHSLISPFFGSPQAINLYWEIYGDQIRTRIKNEPIIQTVSDSNQRYIDKHGALNEEIIRTNITNLSYNETSFNSLYYGALGHDDLISFAKKLIEKYPAIQKKIVKKFAYVFIDEYQDTSCEVLSLFYNAIKGTSVQMFLLGDRMQQIYKNYDGSFENELRTLSVPTPLKTNYRSVKAIVDILNNIYNDPNYYQSVAPGKESLLPDYAPEICISEHIPDEIEKYKNERPDLLILYLLNKDKFHEIGSSTLFASYNRMDKYSFAKKYHAVDVLSDLSMENRDPLMRFLFLFDTLMGFFKQKNFGRIIAYTKRDHEFFISETHSITKHNDKIELLNLYSEIAEKYYSGSLQIGILLAYLKEKRIIREEFYDGIFSDKEYESTLEVSVVELMNLASYLKNPQISTQHGVKGESHTSVLFVAADSNNTPVVHMYDFLRIWAHIDFSLKEIEEFYYEYLSIIADTEKKLGVQVKNLTAATHNNNETNKQILKVASENMQTKFRENRIYELLCKPQYTQYLSNPTLANAKACFKESTVYGCLVAYKIFYVGCSRARKNLCLILDAKKVSAFKEKLTSKLSKIGFSIKES